MDPSLRQILEDSNICALEVLHEINEDLLQLDDSFKIACEEGHHEELVMWFLYKFPKKNYDIDQIKKSGNFEIFKFLMSKYSNTLSDELLIEGFQMACINGNVEILDLILKSKPQMRDRIVSWLQDNPSPEQILSHPFSLSTISGHVNVNNYLLEHFSFIDNHIYEIPDFLQFASACASGHLKMIEWTAKNYFLVISQRNWRTDCFIAACTNCHFGATNKLLEIFDIKSIYSTCYKPCLEFALKNSKRDILYYLVNIFSAQENITDITKKIILEYKQ